MTNSLHIPFDFDRRDVTRLFVRKLQALGLSQPEALLCAYQVWTEWATASAEWRPLKLTMGDNPSDYLWGRDDLTHIIEGYCVGYKGEPGGLILAALESGFILIEQRSDVKGLVLAGFWNINVHLDPQYKTIQQRGGVARAQKQLHAESLKLGAQQSSLITEQTSLALEGNKPAKEEEKNLCALIIRLDRICGKPMRLSRDYSETLIRDALDVTRRFTHDQIRVVETYLLASRENPEVVKDPARILAEFPQHLKNAEEFGQ